MKKLLISASRSYEVLVERGLLDRSGELIKAAAGSKKAVIISGDIVFPLYGQRLKRSLEAAGMETEVFVLPHGEQSKTLAYYGRILEFLSEKHLSRSDVLVALGGGVTGDITGFAASTYQRGMNFVQIPTTLLAAVDSSVGGKTAVDLPGGKNQVGSFYQPALVICDPDLLSTLPEEEFACGCAEVIKYAVLGSRDFFDRLKATPVSRQLEDVMCTCVEMKRDIVALDEFDRGQRQLLNLGHTIGHGVEACSGYQISHGKAVAIGMTLVTRGAVAAGLCPPEVLPRLEALLARYHLPTATDYAAADLYEKTLSDKKRAGDTLSLVVPTAWGKSVLHPIPVGQLLPWIERGLGQ